MSLTASALRSLHRIHRQLGDLNSRLEAGPRRIRAAQTKLVRAEEELTAARQHLQRAKMSADERQLQLKQREDRITDLQAKLNSANSNKEYQALKEQIAADDQANSVLSDEILEMLEKIDELQDAVARGEKLREQARKESEQISDEVSAQNRQLEAELKRVEAELLEAEKSLPADFKPEYMRMVKARGEAALAPVEGEYCGGCHQKLTPQTLNELHLAQPLFCKSCGCLLYVAEDPPG